MAKDTQNVKNIIVGAAALYVTKLDATAAGYDPKVTPFVDATKLVGADAYTAMDSLTGPSGEWRDVGYTDNGVEVSYEPSFGDVTVDQLLDSAKIFKQSMKVTVNTTLAEATLENLLVVWGQGSNTLDTTSVAGDKELSIIPGELGDEPTERGLVFIGPAPRKVSGNVRYDRVYNVSRAIQDQNTNHSLKRSEMTGLPVSFRLLPDPGSAKFSRYGTVRDRARTA